MLTAYNGRGHDLYNLLRHCHYCAPGLPLLFPQDTGREKAIFHLLNSAYLHTRYKSDYAISSADLATLLERVGRLHIQVQQLFEQQLITFKTNTVCQTKPG